MTDEHSADGADEEFDEPEDEGRVEQQGVQVDGGGLPKFDPSFTLETWDTEEGPVVGVRYEGTEVPSAADRVAYVRAAMEHSE